MKWQEPRQRLGTVVTARALAGSEDIECLTPHVLELNDQMAKAMSNYRDYKPAYELRVGSENFGSFHDLRDAITEAKRLREANTVGPVLVVDTTTGFLVIDIC